MSTIVGIGTDSEVLPQPNPQFGIPSTNDIWEGQHGGFFYVVAGEMLKQGFTPAEIRHQNRRRQLLPAFLPKLPKIMRESGSPLTAPLCDALHLNQLQTVAQFTRGSGP